MLGVEMHWSGDTRWIKEAIERTHPSVMHTRVFGPWIRWVTNWRIPEMYRHKGRISGSDGQMQWPVTSEATRQSKAGFFKTGKSKYTGHTVVVGTSEQHLVMLSHRDFNQNKMARAYKIVTSRLSPTSWRFVLSNEARSTSKWSPGFDYPSALHTGWAGYDVRPRADGPGFLAWKTASGMWIFAGKTHPKGAPPRKHIRFFGYDVAKLGKLALEFIFTGKTTELDYHESVV